MLISRYKNGMECDRYDSAYSFSTTMTADNGENEDDGNDDEDREDNSGVWWCRVIRGTMYNHRLAFSI